MYGSFSWSQRLSGFSNTALLRASHVVQITGWIWVFLKILCSCLGCGDDGRGGDAWSQLCPLRGCRLKPPLTKYSSPHLCITARLGLTNSFPREPRRSWSELWWFFSVNPFYCHCIVLKPKVEGGFRLCVSQAGQGAEGHWCHILRHVPGSDILWGLSLENEISCRHKRVWAASTPPSRRTWGPRLWWVGIFNQAFASVSRKFIFKNTLYIQYIKVIISTDSKDR